jgi:hypothetical protein
LQRLDRSSVWLSLVASLAVLVGLFLVMMELRQNTEHLRLQLLDQSTARMTENNRALLGENPTAAIEKSLREPENLTYAEFRIVDAYLINELIVWEDRFFLYKAGLVDASDWKQKIEQEVSWFFGNRFAKNWWREGGKEFVEGELARYIDEAMKAVGDDDTYNYWLRIRPTASSARK